MSFQSFFQSHIPSTADPVNYYIDGQIKQEDYEYASFLQSKMYAAGVTCINCHEPHSMKIKASGNALCTSCHTPAKYDGPQHSFHKLTQTGNQCVSCHMPVSTYMVVDDRLDHSIRIPRPDQSLINGTPNACNKCHVNKTVQWAAANFTRWFGDKLPAKKNYGELVHNISRYIKESEPSLFELLQSNKYPTIIKATAMEQYGYFTSVRVSKLIFEQLKSNEALLRLNAIKAMANYPPEIILQNIQPLLYDNNAAIRMEAMNMLAGQHLKISAENGDQFQKVMIEYMKVQEQMSHRPEGIFNRAVLKNFTGNTKEAEQLYKNCIQRFADFVPAYNNLIDLYREQGRDSEAGVLADKGLLKNPYSPYLHYAKGLWLLYCIVFKRQTGGIYSFA